MFVDMSRCYTARVDKDYKMVHLDISTCLRDAFLRRPSIWCEHCTVRATKYLAPMLNLKRVPAARSPMHASAHTCELCKREKAPTSRILNLVILLRLYLMLSRRGNSEAPEECTVHVGLVDLKMIRHYCKFLIISVFFYVLISQLEASRILLNSPSRYWYLFHSYFQYAMVNCQSVTTVLQY